MNSLKSIAALKTESEWKELRKLISESKESRKAKTPKRTMSEKAKALALALVEIGVNSAQAIELGMKFSHSREKWYFCVICGQARIGTDYMLTRNGVKCIVPIIRTEWNNQKRERIFNICKGERYGHKKATGGSFRVKPPLTGMAMSRGDMEKNRVSDWGIIITKK